MSSGGSDFPWPFENVIQVEALVVDSTYGAPECRREYSQGEAEGRLLTLTFSKLRCGPVHILAHRGTLQRALQVLSGAVDCPILGSPRLCKEAEVYREFGYGIAPLLSTDSDEAREVLGQGRFVRLYGFGDGFPVDLGLGTTITLSAYMARRDDPVLDYTDRSYGVALSNHADFEGTLAYIQATGAKYVITDNTRSGHGVELALEIKSRLGIEAEPSHHVQTREWGV
jgi:putative mRNA 3-end processing factor